MSAPISKQAAALTDAGPSKELLEPATTSESTSEDLAAVFPSNVPEMTAQNPGSFLKPQEHQQPFPLMKLPTEIRLMIFKEFLVMGGSILFNRSQYFVRKEEPGIGHFRQNPPPFVLVGKTKWYWGSRIDEKQMIMQGQCLNLLVASKAIYRETVPIYFGLNTFCFGNLDLFERFIGKLRADFRWQLARVRLGYRGTELARAIKTIISCVGLRELTLDLEPSSIVPTRNARAQIRLFGMKDLLKVRGLTKLELTAAESVYIGNTAIQGTVCQEYMDVIEARLQVLKQPINPKTLKRLSEEDFPVKKMRTLFCNANVVTGYVLPNLRFRRNDLQSHHRDESKALAEQKKTQKKAQEEAQEEAQKEAQKEPQMEEQKEAQKDSQNESRKEAGST